MIDNFTIVDGHVHTFPSDEIADKIIIAFNNIYTIEFENPGNGSLQNVLQNMKETGVDYTVMANFATVKIIHNNNLWTLEMAKKYPCLIPLVSFHPEMEGDLPELLRQYVAAGARGIKLHPMAQGFSPSHEKMQAVYGLCSELGIPVVFHCGRVANARINEYADLDAIKPVMDKYPDLLIVLTHMADGNAEDVLWVAQNYKNVYFDTSIVITGYPDLVRTNEPSWLDDDMVVDIINRVGEDRVIFGSDYPWGSPKHDLERFLKLELTEVQKTKILGENSLKLYNIIYK